MKWSVFGCISGGDVFGVFPVFAYEPFPCALSCWGASPCVLLSGSHRDFWSSGGRMTEIQM